MTKKCDEATAITHAGIFHADEVFATILLEKLFSPLVVARVSELKEHRKDAIIYDIGYGKFDHHQVKKAKYREDGIKYCSFGLLWKKYGMRYLKQIQMPCPKDAFVMFDQDFVEEIDAVDNGEFPKVEALYKVNGISSFIRSFNKTWNEDKDNDEAFLEAVEWARKLFDNEFRVIRSKILARRKVQRAIEKSKDTILVLEEYLPYREVLQQSKKEINFVLFPSERGGYVVNAINKEENPKELKIPFPKEWGGKRNQKLVKVSKVEDATFCHFGLFIAGAKTKEGAILLAKKAIEQHK